MRYPLTIHGRGTRENPAGRFEPVEFERDYEHDAELDPAPRTQFFYDRSQSVISSNDSPDIPYTHTLNPYRGCEHGCIYCYARPTHEYLGLSAGLDFETKIFVKSNAPELLRQHFSSPRWEPQPIAMAGVTDCYQPAERRLELTRRCVQVFAEFSNALWITTKNHLVTRDIDLLGQLAEKQAVCVQISITTLEASLARTMEPRTSSPRLRLEGISKLASAGIPVGVLVAPIIPGLNDHEIPRILAAASDAGAKYAFREMIRLPHANKDLFARWLEDHYPDRAGKVLSHIRQIRGGKLNVSEFGKRMTGEGVLAEQIGQLFAAARKRAGLASCAPELTNAHFRRPGQQLSLF